MLLQIMKITYDFKHLNTRLSIIMVIYIYILVSN